MKMTIHRKIRGWLVALAMVSALVVGSAQAATPVTVFAAASLRTALDDINTAWTAQGHPKASIAYAGSSALARQIEAGAPADIFISADTDWMDYLVGKHKIRNGTSSLLLGNALVLVAPKASTVNLPVAAHMPIAAALGEDGKLAMADTRAVPAGKYGKSALESLDVWTSVSSRIAQAQDVRAALALVSRGEAPLGIVYRTDAHADPGVRIVGTFPESSHVPIRYPAALVDASKHPDAAAFLAFLRSPAAKAIFARESFDVLP
jgi:molybdate transport system substrate-binding protein